MSVGSGYTPAFDFFHDATGLGPDGATDDTQSITRLGPVGIGVGVGNATFPTISAGLGTGGLEAYGAFIQDSVVSNANFAANAAISSANSWLNGSVFTVNQTTAGISMTLVNATGGSIRAGRQMRCINNGTVALTVSGVLIPAGGAADWVMRSNGSWAALTRQMWAGTAVTDASGNATFTFPAGLFPVAPSIGQNLVTAVTGITDLRTTTLTNTTCVVNARQASGISIALLGLTLVGLPVPLVGATVSIVAMLSN